MTIFGLNSPEIFVLLTITLIVLGTKRIEKGFNLFSKLLKFLLNNKSSFQKIEKNNSILDIEEKQEKEDEIKKSSLSKQTKKIEPNKNVEEKQEKEDEIKK